MYSSEENSIVIVRMQDGEEFFETLYNALRKHSVSAGVIISSIGMLRRIEMAFYKGNSVYEEDFIEGPLELVSLQGNVGLKEGEPFAHVHVTLTDESNRAFGGHLKKAIVQYTNELFLRRLEKTRINRKFEESTGLYGMFLE